ASGGVSTDGTLSSGMSVTVIDGGPAPLYGLLIVTATGTAPLSGSGTLINLYFGSLDNVQPRTSDLVFLDYTDPVLGFHPGFRFNDGDPPAVTTNGHIGLLPAGTPTNTPTATPTSTPRRAAFDYDGDGK